DRLGVEGGGRRLDGRLGGGQALLLAVELAGRQGDQVPRDGVELRLGGGVDRAREGGGGRGADRRQRHRGDGRARGGALGVLAQRGRQRGGGGGLRLLGGGQRRHRGVERGGRGAGLLVEVEELALALALVDHLQLQHGDQRGGVGGDGGAGQRGAAGGDLLVQRQEARPLRGQRRLLDL